MKYDNLEMFTQKNQYLTESIIIWSTCHLDVWQKYWNWKFLFNVSSINVSVFSVVYNSAFSQRKPEEEEGADQDPKKTKQDGSGDAAVNGTTVNIAGSTNS